MNTDQTMILALLAATAMDDYCIHCGYVPHYNYYSKLHGKSYKYISLFTCSERGHEYKSYYKNDKYRKMIRY